MKARQLVRSVASLAALSAASGFVTLEAQRMRQPPRPDTPRLMVQVFGSPDKVAGPEVSEALREEMIDSYPSRVLWVMSKEDVLGILEQSGYPTNEQLSRSDEAALAKTLRADEYVRGNVTHDGEVYHVKAQLVLTRDATLTQPLPEVTNRDASDAGEKLADHVDDARKQLEYEKKCLDHARNNRLDEAVKAANDGIKAYPNGTLVRYCKLNVLVRREASSEEKLAMANEILAIDPVSKAALAVAADAQQAAGNTEAANELLVRLLATDPGDAALARRVVDALAASGNYDVAKEIVLKAVAENPGDIGLIRLQFLILSSAGDYKPALKTGEEMVQMDTSLATAEFFGRLVALYAADSQPQKAAEAAARGTQKFPQDASLWQTYAQTLRTTGQLQQSIDAAKRALELDPTIQNGWTQVAIAYNELNQPDSALAALRMAKEAGDDPDQVGGYALNIGNRMFQQATSAQPMVVDSLRKALPYLHFADSTIVDVAAKTNAKFLIGASSYYMASVLAQSLQQTKSCEDAQAGKAESTNATIYVQQGGRAAPDNASQMLGYLNQLLPFFTQSVEQLCKGN